MLLKGGTWWHEDWNKIILPAIKAGTIKQLSVTPKKLRRAGQLYVGTLIEDGIYFKATAYGWTNNKPHVHVEMIGSDRPKWLA